MNYGEEANPTAAWSWREHKIFENALVDFPEGCPDRWKRIAESLPGKSLDDLKAHYTALEQDVDDIEAGLFQLPAYSDLPMKEEIAGIECSPFHLPAYIDLPVNNDVAGIEAGLFHYPSYYDLLRKKDVPGIEAALSQLPACSDLPMKKTEKLLAKGTASVVHEKMKKRGKPWTLEEHNSFLHGMKLYGRGDWKQIAERVVRTRTASQVASHAQKYFIRQNSKLKKRRSIHDVTFPDHNPTLNLTPTPTSSKLTTMEQINVPESSDITPTNSTPTNMETQHVNVLESSDMTPTNSTLTTMEPQNVNVLESSDITPIPTTMEPQYPTNVNVTESSCIAPPELHPEVCSPTDLVVPEAYDDVMSLLQDMFLPEPTDLTDLLSFFI